MAENIVLFGHLYCTNQRLFQSTCVCTVFWIREEQYTEYSEYIGRGGRGCFVTEDSEKFMRRRFPLLYIARPTDSDVNKYTVRSTLNN
jgi:hypothetical protein